MSEQNGDSTAAATTVARDRLAFGFAVTIVVCIMLVPVIAWLGLMVRLFLITSGL